MNSTRALGRCRSGPVLLLLWAVALVGSPPQGRAICLRDWDEGIVPGWPWKRGAPGQDASSQLLGL